MTAPGFILTTGPRSPGARLSLPGHWGNIPFPSVEAAEQEAVRQGGSIIKREKSR